MKFTLDPLHPLGPLDLTDGDTFLAQLVTGKYLSSLRTPVAGRTLHFEALENYFFATDETSRFAWSRCLRHLLSAHAPTDIGDGCAAEMFLSEAWGPTTGLTVELARQYVDAGLIDPKKPIPGRLLAEDEYLDTRGLSGRLPLSAAISMGNALYVRVLVQSGTSWNIGPLLKDGPDLDALEYASSISARSVVAVLTEHLMQKRLGPSSSPTADAPAAAPRRRMAT